VSSILIYLLSNAIIILYRKHKDSKKIVHDIKYHLMMLIFWRPNHDVNRQDFLVSGRPPTRPAIQPPWFRNIIRKVAASVLLLLGMAVVINSLYVTRREADPQETVILGQTRITAGKVR